MAAVRLTEGLDDERRDTGGERGRLARAAEALETDRAAADRVRTVGVGRGVRRAVGPVQIAGGDDVGHSPLFGHARTGQRRDLVVEPAGSALSEPVRGGAG